MAKNKITLVEVLKDGTAKIQTGGFSQEHHDAADSIMERFAQYMGGTIQDQKREEAESFEHHHDHEGNLETE
jgi:hypothetical protein